MKKIFCAIILAEFLTGAAIAESPSQHSEMNVEQKADGSFEGKSEYESTDAAGTKIKTDVVQEESRSAGKTETTVKTTSSTDPKGLMNKSWKKEEVNTVSKDDGNYTKEVTSRAVDASGTAHKVDAETRIVAESDGALEATTTKKSVTDPKGLWNKSVTETTETVRQGPDGTVTKIVKKDVDGKTVESTVR